MWPTTHCNLREFVFSKLPSSWTRARVKAGLSARPVTSLPPVRLVRGRVRGSGVSVYNCMSEMADFGLSMSVSGTELVHFVGFRYRAREKCSHFTSRRPPPGRGIPGIYPGDPRDPLSSGLRFFLRLLSQFSKEEMRQLALSLPSRIESVFEGRDAETNASLPSPSIMAVARDAKHAKNPPRARPGHPGVRNASFS